MYATKKFILASILLFTIIALPSSTLAQTTDNSVLTQMVQSLQAMLKQLTKLASVTSNKAEVVSAIPSSLGWYQIPNTTLRTVCPPNGFGGSSYNFRDNCPMVVIAWNSAVLDTKRNRLIVWGGGHNDYHGNELYAVNMSDLTIERITDPGLPTAGNSCPESLANGTQPNSRHTYDGITYMENVDKMFSFGGALAACGFFNRSTWLFNFATNKWEVTNPSGPIPGLDVVVTDYDKNSGLVYLHDNLDLFTYNPLTNTYTRLSNNQVGLPEYHFSGTIDPLKKKFILIGEGFAFMYDISSGSSYTRQVLTTSGGSSIISSPYPGLSFDSSLGKIVAWHGGNTVYALDLGTNTWSPTTYSGGPGAAPGQGTHGRFAYVPSLNVFVLVNDMESNAYTLRLSNGTTPPPTPTPVNGLCGTAHGVSVSSAPSANLCSTGSASSVTTNTSTYTWSCGGTNGGTTAQCTAPRTTTTLPPTTQIPSATLTSSPASITTGSSATLTWSSVNSTSCTASGGWTGTKATSGTGSVSPTTNTTYALTCTGAGGTSPSVSTSVTVTTTPPPTSGTLPIGTLAHDGPATPEQLSLILPVTGSLSQTAVATVKYKSTSASSWTTGHPLYRIRPTLSETPPTGSVPDAFAWPIIDLTPGTTYDVEVTIVSGGVTDIRTGRFVTRAIPLAAGTPNKTITAGASFATIQTALDGLNPGDVLEFQNGTYVINNNDRLQINRSGTAANPIYIRGASRTGTIIKNTGLLFQVLAANYIVLENMTLVGSEVDSGVNAGSTGISFYNGSPSQTQFTVRNITMSGVDIAIKSYAPLTQFMAYDNTFSGNNTWISSLLTTNATWNDDGVCVPGYGNVVFNNSLKGFGDTFAFTVDGVETRGVHIYRNEVRNSGDDLLEADYAMRNLSFYDNRSHNSMTFLSLDPLYGGPLVVARNSVINTGRSPFKWNSTNSGHFVYNNTIIKTTGTGSHASWAWVQFNNGSQSSWGYQNNVLIHQGTGNLLAFESGGNDPVDVTHNSWFPDKQIWWSNSGGSYTNLAGTYAGLPVTTPVFSGSTKRHQSDTITTSNPWTDTISLGSDFLTEVTATYTPIPATGSVIKSTGTIIPNITDSYSGSAPDRGALISGRGVVSYGDRSGIAIPPPPVTPPTTPADTTPPTVSLTTPAPETTVSGTAVNITANATDNIAMKGVQFRIDGVDVGPLDTTLPYGITWNTTLVQDGTHTITAKGEDTSGNVTTSGTITVTVKNTLPEDTTPPTISITTPTNGSTVSGTAVPFSANATDNVGIAGVTFRVDNVIIDGEDTTFPYGLLLSTALYTPGTHTATAEARDTKGNKTMSTTITFIIATTPVVSDTTAPSVPLRLVVAAPARDTLHLSWSQSTDNVGVSGYLVERCEGSTCTTFKEVGVVTANGYEDKGLSTNTGYRYQIRATDAAGNRSGYSSIVTGQTLTKKSSGGGGGGGGKKSKKPKRTDAHLTPAVAITETPRPASGGTTKTTFTTPLYLGSTGSEVKALQTILISKGYLASDSVTGLYGPQTMAAVKKYQCAKGLACSGTPEANGYGLVGQKTRALLNSEGGTTIIPVTTNTPTGTITQVLAKGMNHPEVATLQSFLMKQGYLTPDTTTTFFGTLTEAALKRFQCDKLSVCRGNKDTTGYGATGPRTRGMVR